MPPTVGAAAVCGAANTPGPHRQSVAGRIAERPGRIAGAPDHQVKAETVVVCPRLTASDGAFLCYSACFGLAGTLAGGGSFLVLGLKGNEMRLSLFAALLVAVWASPADAARPVTGAVQGTATAATGVARGAGQAGVGIVRGTSTAVREPREDSAAW